MGRLSRMASPEGSVDEEPTAHVKREGSAADELGDDLSAPGAATIKHENPASPSRRTTLATVRTKVSRSSSTSTTSSKHALALDKDMSSAKKSNGHTSPVKPEPEEPTKPTKPTKTSRAASSKLPPRIAPLLDHLPDVYDEATSTFSVLDACTYQNKYLGFSDHALDCDCSEEWGQFPCSIYEELLAN